VIHEGPSLLDGSPIVAIATGLHGRSQNAKTGPMVQTWILRADRAPSEAVRDGSDGAICGACVLRGAPGFTDRRCYVNVGQAPQSVWGAWRRGLYPMLESGQLAGQRVRLGAYGDPAAVPVEAWLRALAGIVAWTGYTHQWAHPNFDRRVLDWCMASLETDAEVAQLERLHPGARYFRVRVPGQKAGKGEMQCPASAEADHQLDCVSCGACDGKGATRMERSVTIAAHGAAPQMRTWNAGAGGRRARPEC
jgi:hypothetical protein